MTILRLRYENGQFIPLDPVPDLHEGAEIEVEWRMIDQVGQAEDMAEMLDRTRGMWAGEEWDGVEEYLAQARKEWDKAWRNKSSSW